MTQLTPYVLVAEDDIDDVDFFTAAFSSKCPEIFVKHFSDGASVVDYLKACPADQLPTFLLIDYKMPVASGVDILRYLQGKQQFASVGKAVWSTSGRATEIEECRSLGAKHFFTKPASEEEWHALVLKICDFLMPEKE